MAAVPRTPLPDPAARRRFQRRLLGWYARHRRDLPWRRTSDPYHILVSEIMLQQTQVDRVIPKYHEFIARYPTLESLARARTSSVKRLWYPLGYNIRPVHLQGIARETLARYDGRLPDDARALRSMRGIGPYTAGAILAFAYRQDAALVDTNVRRVLTRVFLGPRRGRRASGDKAVWALAQGLVPASLAYDYNQALMDFGATWCTARVPRCAGCTMRTFCASYGRSADGKPNRRAPGRSDGKPNRRMPGRRDRPRTSRVARGPDPANDRRPSR